MEPIQLLLAGLSGGVVALLLTVFGGGGSVLAVPLLLYVVGVRDPHVAIGASAAGVSLNALTALAGQAKARRVRWPCAVMFAVVGATAAWFGSSAAKAIDGHHLLLAFAMAMAAVGLAMMLPKKSEGDPGVRLNRGMAPRMAMSGAGVGVAAGTMAGLPLSKRLGANAALGRQLFAGLILIVAVYVAFKAITGG